MRSAGHHTDWDRKIDATVAWSNDVMNTKIAADSIDGAIAGSVTFSIVRKRARAEAVGSLLDRRVEPDEPRPTVRIT
jgi:hypothetical protein